MTTEALQTAQRAADELRSHTGVDSYKAAFVMGSGWAPGADALGEEGTEVPMSALPGFRPPAVTGHPGRIRSVRSGDRDMLVLLGRTHLYEGHGPAAVVHGVRTAIAAGASTVVLTNAAGSLDRELTVGSPVLIADHINLTGASPLDGANFVDLSETYSASLRAVAREANAELREGVYAAMRGPQFETPAEIRMLRAMGADLVGMSTALEAVAAREQGASVLGISLVTNVAAGLSDHPLDHHEVLETGRDAAADAGGLLAAIAAKV
ncbi:purine-nucleoside phosphorylase [Allosalinactinospora lopnorensis]|uniref:purine-nucleoside phosphorylase n=1 Tax=Allosalinactinospora lopnorensis TaxID=1352348 RepID=UPI000623F5A2|nr:purine-nucleoside phosphorylase [Allosalinactinospora lopnorensis]